MGKTRNDAPGIICDTGGLQYCGYKIELFNRFENFESEWLNYWYENYTLIDGHVLRGGLRVVNADEYPFILKPQEVFPVDDEAVTNVQPR